MRSASLLEIRGFITGVFLIVLIVAQTTVAKPTALEMSSSNNRNFGPRYARSPAGNFPLVNSALSINSDVKNGRLTPAQAREEANRLIQANKYNTNLQILNGSLGK